MPPKTANQRDLRFHFRVGTDAEFRTQVAEMAEALTRINTLEILKYNDHIPCCLGCGEVRYVPPPGCGTDGRPCQEVYDILEVFARKRGTCLDLAPARAARLRADAILAGEAELPASEVAAVVIEDQLDEYERPMPGFYHAFVRLADGSEQDPSTELQDSPPGACSCPGCGLDQAEGMN
jgi:hypothetical protein